MAVFHYLEYRDHNAIKLIPLILAIISMYMTSAAVHRCPDKCFCYDAAVDCSGKGLKIVGDILPQQTKTLLLDENKLEEIPDFSYLTHLEKLSLSQNNIKEINSSRISCLLSLKELDLSHNDIRSLPLQSFSSGNQLKTLDLSFNNLTSLAGLSASLPRLEYLYLQYNRLTNIDVIRQNSMPKLTILRVGHNNIHELVATLDKSSVFPNLQTLDFNNNRIEQIDMFLTRFKYLRKLILSYNKLKTINASSFIRNADLEELYLDHNELSSVTNLWLTFKPKLTHLDMRYNRIHTIDSGTFQSAQHIKYLDVSNNHLGKLEPKIFSHLQNLSYLNLHNNAIEYVSEDAFSNLNMLISLNMSHNQLNIGNKEFDNAFKPLKLLKILDLNDNNILLIPSNAFLGLSNLKTLYMRNNRIRVIETNAFKELKTIMKLHFDTEDLFCDCSLKYLQNYIMERSYMSMARGVCSSPLWLKGKNVMDVLDSEVVCVNSVKPMVRPLVIVHPQSKYVHLHGNTSLYCVSSSSVESDMQINWYQKIGSTLVKHHTSLISKQEAISSRLYRRSSMLTLENVRFRDAGQYYCHTANLYGSDKSKPSNITVVVRPSLSPDLQKEIVALSGEDILIPCSAEGLPTPTIKFTKERGDLPFHAVLEKRIVYSNHKFGIKNLKIEDSGLYSCSARSPVGTANATIRLMVKEKPKFVRPMKSRSFISGKTAWINCIISGNPRPKITWYKDGRQLKGSTSKIQLSDQLLVIMSFDYNDEGLYGCQASNSLGTVRETAHLTVRNKDMTSSSSKMASDVFISIIVVVVVVVIILTSLAWVALICFCRKRGNKREEKGENEFMDFHRESLLSEMPKDYVLRCNGKLVSVPKNDEICDDYTLLAEKLSLVQEHPEHIFGILPKLSSVQQTDNEDDSGISLVYSKFPDEQFGVCSQESNEKFHKPYLKKTKILNNVDEEAKASSFPSKCEKEWGKCKHLYHSSNQIPFRDPNSLTDDKYSNLQRKGSKSNRLKHTEFDPTRLKLNNSMKPSQNSPARFTNFSSDSVHETGDYYHSYVTSSSGIESGDSSENVSLSSDEIMVANGMVAV